MAYRITNIAPGPRGIWAAGTLVWLEPGQTKTFEPDSIREVTRNASFEVELDEALPKVPKGLADLATAAKKDALDHDGDGKPGGSAKGAQSTRAKGAAKRKTTGRAKASK